MHRARYGNTIVPPHIFGVGIAPFLYAIAGETDFSPLTIKINGG